MKKNVKRINPLTLNKETLRNLELPKNAVVGRVPPPNTEWPECIARELI